LPNQSRDREGAVALARQFERSFLKQDTRR
jgi:hypothetical protein